MQNKHTNHVGLQCRKIDNNLNLNVNMKIQHINKNLQQEIHKKEKYNQYSQDIDFKQILKKKSNNSSTKYLQYKTLITTSKQIVTTTKKKPMNSLSTNLINKQNKSLINALVTISNNNSINIIKNKKTKKSQLLKIIKSNKNKKNQSPGSSLEKRAKSLSKLDKKHKKSVNFLRKSLSPKHTYKIDKKKKQTSKSKTSRQFNKQKQNLSSTITNNSNNPKSGNLTQRLNIKKPLIQQQESTSKQKSLGKKKLKKKSLKIPYQGIKLIDNTKSILDSQSVYLAKQLHKISTQKNLKIQPNKKISEKKKGKKVILSQNVSKNKQFSLKENQNQNEILPYKYRNSYQPEYKPLKTIKEKKKTKKLLQTINNEYSSPNPQRIRNEAARLIQKVFRGYLARKQIQQYKRYILAVLTIQRHIRGYLARKLTKKKRFNQDMPRPLNQESLRTIKNFNQQKNYANQSKSNTPQKEMSSMSIEQKEVKNKYRIKKLLESLDSSCSQSKSQFDKKSFQSPKNHHPPKELEISIRSRPQIKIESPTTILGTLPNLQKLHKQKLIHNCNMQKQSLLKLLEQKCYSPKTYEIKIKQLQQRLKYQIQRFELGVKQLVRGWNLTNQQGLGFSTPDNGFKKAPQIQLKSQQKIKNEEIYFNPIENSDNKMQDMSIQLSQYTQQKQIQNDQIMKFDSSIMFIQSYLNDLLIFLENCNDWKEQFLQTMKTPKSIQIGVLLKNLTFLTEESQQDNNFKLPLYKYLKYSIPKLIPEELIQQFHNEYQRLKRNSMGSPSASYLQELHLKMIVDVLDQQLYRQRPIKPLLSFQPLKFTAKVHNSLVNKELQTQQLIFQNYFAFAFDQVYRYASQLCGFIQDNKQIQENYLNIVNDARLSTMINYEINLLESQNLKYEQQKIEVKVALSQEIFNEIMQELFQDIYPIMYQ